MPKRIESGFPFAQLSLIAERESWRKEIYRPVYYLHKWWAKRLGSVFRGILLGACLDETDDFWKQYYSANDFVERTVFDPFMGSGVTVGEAVKLGCRAVGRDINPVAYLSCQAAMSQYSSAEVLSTFQQLDEELAPTLLPYFSTETREGDEALVLYYFLVKVVACPNCSRNIDLFKTRIFSRNAAPRKDPSARSVCPDCGELAQIRYDAETACCPACSMTYDPRRGNVKGATVSCPHCEYVFRLVDRMKQLKSPLGFRRYAKLILTQGGRKVYEPINDCDREVERRVAVRYAEVAGSFPQIAIAPGYNTDQLLKHNYRYWHQMVSDRQLVCIRHMVDAIKGIDRDDLRLLFACFFSGVLEFNNLFTSFKGEGTGAVRHMFSHHVLKPETMPIEANIWGTSKSSGAFSTLFRSRVERAIAYKTDPFELRVQGNKSSKVHGINKQLALPIASDFAQFQSDAKAVYLSSGDSSCTDLADQSIDLVITDPPFFDNVHYSQLADFFYYWLNQTLEISPSETTRSPREVQDTNPGKFTAKLTSVFAEIERVLRPEGLLIFTYHHSRHEGWTALHRAIRHSGFVCCQSYPIKAEMSVAMPLKQAKSPIHLDLIMVCRRETERKNLQQADPAIAEAVRSAKQQVASLKEVGIRVSLGDAKVILMGRLLREIHHKKDPEMEEKMLDCLGKGIDAFVSQVMSTEGEVLYDSAGGHPTQLTLFDRMESYLTDSNSGYATVGAETGGY